MSNNYMENVAGGTDSYEIRAVETPENIPKFVVVNKSNGNWVGLFGVEYLPGTYNVTESSVVDILAVLRSATSVVTYQPNFRRSAYPVTIKGADGIFQKIGTNGGLFGGKIMLNSTNGEIVSPTELYQNVPYLGTFVTPTSSAY